MRLEFLKDLCQAGDYRDGSGFVTVYLDTSPTEATRKEVGLRWRAARDELARAGADDQTLDALAGRVSATRAGARLLTCPQLGPDAEVAVEGEHWPVHKVSQGAPAEHRLRRSEKP